MSIEREDFQLFVLFDAFVELVSGEAASLGTRLRLSDVDNRSSWLWRDEILDLAVDEICWSSFRASRFNLE